MPQINLLFSSTFLKFFYRIKLSKRMILKIARLIIGYWIDLWTAFQPIFGFSSPLPSSPDSVHYPCFSILTYQCNLTREGRCTRPNMKAAARWKKVEEWGRKWPIRQNSKGIRLCPNNAFHSVGTVAIWIRVKPRNSASIVLQLWWWQITRG